MIKFSDTEVYGWGASIRGARNPMNSWEKSDSHLYRAGVVLGENDMNLLKRLATAGDDHGKFARMIIVSVDITAPEYWWSQADTYKIGTAANSCSKMHKIHERDLTPDDFSKEYLNCESLSSLKRTIDQINRCRAIYVETGEKAYWYNMIQLLPMCYNQKRTWQANYQVLKHIYQARKNHKLNEWRDFCKWIETLPYAKELIIGEE